MSYGDEFFATIEYTKYQILVYRILVNYLPSPVSSERVCKSAGRQVCRSAFCKSAVCVCRTPRLKLVSVPFSRLVLDMVTLRKDFRRASCIWSAICFKIMTRYTPIRAVFSHVYLQPFLVHDIRAFFCYLYLRSFPLCGVFIPKYMTIFLQTRIYIRTKKFIHMRYKQACVYGVTESCHIRRTELYCQQKTSSCTMELKSNFSLNQAWPQWPR